MLLQVCRSRKQISEASVWFYRIAKRGPMPKLHNSGKACIPVD